MATFIELAQSLYPNMPPDILELFASEWSKTGDPNVAISALYNMIAIQPDNILLKDSLMREYLSLSQLISCNLLLVFHRK